MTRKRYIKKLVIFFGVCFSFRAIRRIQRRIFIGASGKKTYRRLLSWDVLMMKRGQKWQRLLEPLKEWRTSNETLD